MWVNSRFLPRMVLSSSQTPSSIEVTFVRLFCVSFSLICCAIYIPPGLKTADHDIIIDYLIFEIDRLLTMYPDDKIVISGDFNDFNAALFGEYFGLINRVLSAKRKDVVLDHIWIDEGLCDCYPHEADVGPPLGKSDHNSILLRSVSKSLSEENRRPTLVWDFRESHISECLLCVSSINFDVIKQEASVDEMCSKFYELLFRCMSVIPCETVFFSSNDKPWMTILLAVISSGNPFNFVFNILFRVF